ncbi:MULTISPECIES: XkdF-like putative serine protease domain-containing protein [Caproicibacterium]|uniref:XkdF-like putative serine protease domain-containing protein n=1 Tax=Caproicibacterium argilliputei TaxID=3030016 RepID=A0AA97DDJ8_9FIRM|nr:XkdF-like putative serine protease domain-containing protein [Caproicibacterium argilliputei]WOC33471.1 XkdF-like putative serine protease domain-containing protein [Caproicibacterium argilliputei]
MAEAKTFNQVLGAPAVQKSRFRIFKTDEDKHLVFGWANISIRQDGEEILDYQQDMIDPDDLETAAYEYVLNFRDGGEEHNPDRRKVARLVESCVFTADKLVAMGLPVDAVPQGWWIGFYVDDANTWDKIKDGTYQMFSIEGTATRQPVEGGDSDENSESED